MIRLRTFLLLSALILVLFGCAAFQPRLEQPHINLVGFDIREIGVLQQRYLLTLNVQNPNRHAIPIRGMSYALQIAGDDFARGVSPKAFTLPAYGEAQVEVELTTNLISALRRLQKLVEMNEDVVSYELTGKLDVGSGFYDGTLPFSNRGEFKLTF